uniref:Sacchrp_dh_C domain-containing protein n=1 Tax=Steinernema glaseri TaxID=37863 RepID=A0A1I7YPW2_9BILA
MEMKYNALAREKGLFVVGACGFDSMPCDLGVHFLKRSFKGDLCYVETVFQNHYGEAGYTASATTYDTLIHSLSEEKIDELRRVRTKIMPEKMPLSKFKPPKRPVNQERPVRVETYFRGQNFFWASAHPLWLGAFRSAVQHKWARDVLRRHPEFFSFGMFSREGATREQLNQTTFTYWFFGHGWNEKLPLDKEHSSPPEARIVARCQGPDPAYLSTAGCVLSAAVTLLEDGALLPERAGVLTTASAFGNTRIYERLASFGITFDIVEDGSPKAHL